MNRVVTAFLAGVLMMIPWGFASASQPDNGAGDQGCNCGREPSAEDSRGATCVCLFYEFAIYVPPPPSDPIYYYSGMCCNPNWGGTCTYLDTIRRRTGTNQCRVENGQVICPTDPPETSNCFREVYRAVAAATEKSHPPEKPIPISPPHLGKVGAKKIPPGRDVVTLILYPEYPGKFTASYVTDLKAGSKILRVKLQLLELKVPVIPGGPEVETVKIGLGRQCVGQPPDAVPIHPAKVTPIPPAGNNAEETKLVLIEHDGTVYTVLLEDSFPLKPTPAD